jgi:hypothetical protein
VLNFGVRLASELSQTTPNPHMQPHWSRLSYGLKTPNWNSTSQPHRLAASQRQCGIGVGGGIWLGLFRCLIFSLFYFFTRNQDFDFKINLTVCQICEVTLSKKCNCVLSWVQHQ